MVALPTVKGTRDFFATCPKGMEELLAEELSALGAGAARAQRAGVSFRGPLEVAYRACLWSRLASRILLPLTTFPARDAQELYDGVRGVAWLEHLLPTGTLAIDVSMTRPPAQLAHSHFVALRTKDAIVDQLRQQAGQRPSIELHQPSVRVNVHVAGDQATLSIDLSGESLHRRGYRIAGKQTEAPLKENLAAAILLRAGWPRMAAAAAGTRYAKADSPVHLIDPLCGSATLLIEGAWLAADVAPGLLRAEAHARPVSETAGARSQRPSSTPRFGFLGWRGHDEQLWQTLARPVPRSSSATIAIPAPSLWRAPTSREPAWPI